MVETILSLTFGGMAATMHVSLNPGAMPATRMWQRASSLAQVTVMAATPALAAA